METRRQQGQRPKRVAVVGVAALLLAAGIWLMARTADAQDWFPWDGMQFTAAPAEIPVGGAVFLMAESKNRSGMAQAVDGEAARPDFRGIRMQLRIQGPQDKEPRYFSPPPPPHFPPMEFNNQAIVPAGATVRYGQWLGWDEDPQTHQPRSLFPVPGAYVIDTGSPTGPRVTITVTAGAPSVLDAGLFALLAGAETDRPARLKQAQALVAKADCSAYDKMVLLAAEEDWPGARAAGLAAEEKRLGVTVASFLQVQAAYQPADLALEYTVRLSADKIKMGCPVLMQLEVKSRIDGLVRFGFRPGLSYIGGPIWIEDLATGKTETANLLTGAVPIYAPTFCGAISEVYLQKKGTFACRNWISRQAEWPPADGPQTAGRQWTVGGYCRIKPLFTHPGKYRIYAGDKRTCTPAALEVVETASVFRNDKLVTRLQGLCWEARLPVASVRYVETLLKQGADGAIELDAAERLALLCAAGRPGAARPTGLAELEKSWQFTFGLKMNDRYGSSERAKPEPDADPAVALRTTAVEYCAGAAQYAPFDGALEMFAEYATDPTEALRYRRFNERFETSPALNSGAALDEPSLIALRDHLAGKLTLLTVQGDRAATAADGVGGPQGISAADLATYRVLTVQAEIDGRPESWQVLVHQRGEVWRMAGIDTGIVVVGNRAVRSTGWLAAEHLEQVHLQAAEDAALARFTAEIAAGNGATVRVVSNRVAGAAVEAVNIKELAARALALAPEIEAQYRVCVLSAALVERRQGKTRELVERVKFEWLPKADARSDAVVRRLTLELVLNWDGTGLRLVAPVTLVTPEVAVAAAAVVNP